MRERKRPRHGDLPKRCTRLRRPSDRVRRRRGGVGELAVQAPLARGCRWSAPATVDACGRSPPPPAARASLHEAGWRARASRRVNSASASGRRVASSAPRSARGRAAAPRPRRSSRPAARGGAALGARRRRRGPAQELADREGLAEVVVGAELEPQDAVELLVLRGEQEGWGGSLRVRRRVEELETVEPRHEDVEDREVGEGVLEARPRLQPVRERLGPTRPRQRERDRAAEALLVVDEGDERGDGRVHAGNLAHPGAARPDRHEIVAPPPGIATAAFRWRHGPRFTRLRKRT